jgi:exodeoxyribonuclease VII large subunit
VALEAIAATTPKTRDELLAIKGLKEKKFERYGAELLALIGGAGQTEALVGEVSSESGKAVADPPLSVSQFLDAVNVELSGMAARVRGEVTSVDERPRAVYFSLKDKEDGSVLNCIIFRYQYDVSGVKLTIGDEIIVEGVPEIYKPFGKFSLKVGVIEFAGEGALKKSYDELKKKLETEGLFAPQRKRTLPELPERIALITSQSGAAIDDFRMNLGRFGFRVTLFPVSVEGKRAVFEIIKALEYFNRRPEEYDILVMIRGGGSLESLQAFNNETLVRTVATSRIPTLLGIGHEKDVSLAALSADLMVSTPTATAERLRLPWNEARQLVGHFRTQLPLLYLNRITAVRLSLASGSDVLLARLAGLGGVVAALESELRERARAEALMIRQRLAALTEYRENVRRVFQTALRRAEEVLVHSEERLRQVDPRAVLRLGYSIVRAGGKVLRDARESRIGDMLEIRLHRGSIRSEVREVESDDNQ